MFDTTGSYEISFLLCIAALLHSSRVVIRIKPGKHHTDLVSE